MHLPTVLDRLFLPMTSGRRPRRWLTPAVRPLEGRQLLSASALPLASATMTQTAMFPNPKLLPNMATQAFLYYNSTMGTLTEVDLGASGPGIPAAPPLVLTSPADLAAFTGNYRIPTSVVESAATATCPPTSILQHP